MTHKPPLYRSKAPLYIFDLDGTLSLTHKRQHLIENGKRNAAAWDAFYDACDTDPPNLSVIKTLDFLRETGCETWIFSGRRAEVREKTIAWLEDYTTFSRKELEVCLTMRDIGDNTEDSTLKLSWYNQLLQEDQQRLVAVFDDRDRVVNMWRSLGITCFQVAPGNF